MNPRYAFTAYDSLANYWFKPLTHHSVAVLETPSFNDTATGERSNQEPRQRCRITAVNLVIFRKQDPLDRLDHSVNKFNVHFLYAIGRLRRDHDGKIGHGG